MTSNNTGATLFVEALAAYKSKPVYKLLLENITTSSAPIEEYHAVFILEAAYAVGYGDACTAAFEKLRNK